MLIARHIAHLQRGDAGQERQTIKPSSYRPDLCLKEGVGIIKHKAVELTRWRVSVS